MKFHSFLSQKFDLNSWRRTKLVEIRVTEEERERQRRIDLAEQEARVDLLRKKVRLSKGSDQVDEIFRSSEVPSSSSTNLVDFGHVNLFQHLLKKMNLRQNWGLESKRGVAQNSSKKF